jgi:hypothetical protein
MNRSIALVAALLAATVPSAGMAQCPMPDPHLSYFVPQVGSVAAPTEGINAIKLFRACPNNDGGASLPNNARIKVVLRDAAGNPIVGEKAIYMLFNGGTTAQGFFGIGADSIISNGTWNIAPSCPDLKEVLVTSPTDATGTTYITFTGGDSGTPGVGVRDPGRKWGHYDDEIPVYVGLPPCTPIKIFGRLTTGSPLGSYTLRIRNFDVVGGLGAVLNQGELVSATDFNKTLGCASAPGGLNCAWCDYDLSGSVTAVDLNMISAHMGHDCDTPLSP